MQVKDQGSAYLLQVYRADQWNEAKFVNFWLTNKEKSLKVQKIWTFYKTVLSYCFVCIFVSIVRKSNK